MKWVCFMKGECDVESWASILWKTVKVKLTFTEGVFTKNQGPAGKVSFIGKSFREGSLKVASSKLRKLYVAWQPRWRILSKYFPITTATTLKILFQGLAGNSPNPNFAAWWTKGHHDHKHQVERGNRGPAGPAGPQRMIKFCEWRRSSLCLPTKLTGNGHTTRRSCSIPNFTVKNCGPGQSHSASCLNLITWKWMVRVHVAERGKASDHTLKLRVIMNYQRTKF